jgi:hypothetical protein
LSIADTQSHSGAFFQPTDSTEGTQKEDAFGGSECNHAFSEAGGDGVAPFESPLCFALNARLCFNFSEEMLFLCRVFDVRVDEE